MSHINLPRTLDQVSEDEVEITQIVKSACGNIIRDTAKAESLSNFNSLTSGPNLGLDERQKLKIETRIPRKKMNWRGRP